MCQDILTKEVNWAKYDTSTSDVVAQICSCPTGSHWPVWCWRVGGGPDWRSSHQSASSHAVLCTSTSSSKDHFHIHPPDSQPQADVNSVNCKKILWLHHPSTSRTAKHAQSFRASAQPVKAATQRIVSSYPCPLSCSMRYNACKSEDKGMGEWGNKTPRNHSTETPIQVYTKAYTPKIFQPKEPVSVQGESYICLVSATPLSCLKCIKPPTLVCLQLSCPIMCASLCVHCTVCTQCLEHKQCITMYTLCRPMRQMCHLAQIPGWDNN